MSEQAKQTQENKKKATKVLDSPGMLSSISYFAHDQGGKFPLNTVFSLETFSIYQGMADFISGFVEYPLALAQAPIAMISGRNHSMPCNSSQIQTAINCSRYRNVNTDVI